MWDFQRWKTNSMFLYFRYLLQLCGDSYHSNQQDNHLDIDASRNGIWKRFVFSIIIITTEGILKLVYSLVVFSVSLFLWFNVSNIVIKTVKHKESTPYILKRLLQSVLLDTDLDIRFRLNYFSFPLATETYILKSSNYFKQTPEFSQLCRSPFTCS